MAKSTIAGNIVGWTMSAILVNKDGNRVVNEKASNRTILEEELKQEGGELYLLLDAETFEAWKAKLAPAGISDADIEKYPGGQRHHHSCLRPRRDPGGGCRRCRHQRRQPGRPPLRSTTASWPRAPTMTSAEPLPT